MARPLSTSRAARLLAAAVVLVGGAALAQVPDLGTGTPTATTEGQQAVTSTAGGASPSESEKTADAGGEQQEGELSLVGQEPLAATFNDTATVRPRTATTRAPREVLVAPVTVVLKIPENADGTIGVKYVAASDGKPQALRSGPRVSAPHPVVYPAARSTVRDYDGELRFPVAGGSTKTLALRLAIPPSTEVGQASGLVQVDLRSRNGGIAVPPLAVQVDGAPPEVRFVPTTLQMRATRLGSDAGKRADLQVLGSGAEALRLMGDRSVILRGPGNGDLSATLRYPDESDGDGVAAEVELDDVDDTGKYEGGVSLDPNGPETTALPLVVEVQDAFWVPLVVLALSAFLGGFAINAWNVKRRRHVLWGALKDAVYQHRGVRQGVRNFYPLDEDLGVEEATWPRFPPFSLLRRKESREPDQNWRTVDRLHWDIGEAGSDEEFNDRGQRVLAVVSELHRWQRLLAEREDLSDEVRRAKLERGDPALEDSRDLIDGLQADPGAGERTDEYLRQLGDQQRALHLYASLYHAWWGLQPFQRKAIASSDPTKAYTPIQERTDDAKWAALPITLARALGEVRRAAYLAEPSEDERARREELLAQAGEPAAGSGDLIDLLDALDAARLQGPTQHEIMLLDSTDRVARARGPESRPRARPPEHARDTRRASDILAGVKRWDFLVALATTLVAIVAFLLPKYTENHTFGSWEDYLNLAVLGFLGAATTGGLVLNWASFPQLRPYSVASVTKPAGANGGGGDGPDEDDTEQPQPDAADGKKPAEG